MRLVDKQVLRELVGPFLFGVAAFSSVFFAGAMLPKLTEWLMNGMPTLTAAKVVVLSLPAIVVYTLPMSTLLAVLLGLGRLSSDSEVVALFASGISLYRMVLPVICMGLMVAGFSVLLNEVVAPQANLASQELQAEVFKSGSLADRPFTLMDEKTGSLVRVNGGLDRQSGIMRDVTIIQYERKAGPNGHRTLGAPRMVWYAATAKWEGLHDQNDRYRWMLYDGSWWLIVDPVNTASGSFVQQQTREVVLSKTPEQLALYRKDSEQMTFRELSRLLAQVKANPDRPLKDIRRLDVDRWSKLALPLSSLVFAMLAAPLAIRPHRSSSSMGMGLSILLIFLYYMMWRYTSQLAYQGSLSPFYGAFAADIAGLAVAVVLLKRAAK